MRIRCARSFAGRSPFHLKHLCWRQSQVKPVCRASCGELASMQAMSTSLSTKRAGPMAVFSVRCLHCHTTVWPACRKAAGADVEVQSSANSASALLGDKHGNPGRWQTSNLLPALPCVSNLGRCEAHHAGWLRHQAFKWVLRAPVFSAGPLMLKAIRLATAGRHSEGLASLSQSKPGGAIAGSSPLSMIGRPQKVRWVCQKPCQLALE